MRFTQEAIIAQVRVEYSSSCADSSLKQFTDIAKYAVPSVAPI